MTAGGGPEDAGAGTRRRRPRAEPSPAQRALGLLVRREHSRRELERKLATRGVGVDDARAAVRQMAEAGWQDDGRFAASLARTRALAGYGPVRIRVELEGHGLDAAQIAHAFAALAEGGEDDWPGRARELVARRFPVPGDEDPEAARTRLRKAADFLLRRGFDVDTARVASGLDDDAQ
ncbi:recombination regulator RecX [Luteimonas sp. Y-2-2-4F]|nr:regulatory protein RecX [Luteimonas sp. Y-2-2-4F]MCD9031615.1 recombination regulator RecX [Luteimonas sp. Y-2-2-4F]MCD9031810.1 recombination regulator RecX [Luteimonas sp. Y-2-2-4F]